MNIVVVGSLNMDLVVRIPTIPRPGETLLGGVFHTYPGGKGANQAVAAARLGGSVTMIGCVGSDSFGKELIDNLESQKINTQFVSIQPSIPTGVALIQVDDNAQNSIAVASGANFCLTSEYVRDTLLSLNALDIVVAPLETPLDTIYAAASAAKQRGAKMILNPAPAQTLGEDLLGLVDYLIPNEYEIATVAGLSVRQYEDMDSAAEKLIGKGVENLIVTLGDKGSLLFAGNKKSKMIIPAWSVQAVDTTAAGDCFIGALAVGLSQRKSLDEATDFASAAAALCVTRVGAQPSLPFYNEVVQFMNEGERKV